MSHPEFLTHLFSTHDFPDSSEWDMHPSTYTNGFNRFPNWYRVKKPLKRLINDLLARLPTIKIVG